jgi:hypothetical protein
VKAPPPDAKPYGWVIEYPITPIERHVFFIPNNGDQDKAYAMQRAVAMHGELMPVERSREGGVPTVDSLVPATSL